MSPEFVAALKSLAQACDQAIQMIPTQHAQNVLFLIFQRLAAVLTLLATDLENQKESHDANRDRHH